MASSSELFWKMVSEVDRDFLVPPIDVTVTNNDGRTSFNVQIYFTLCEPDHWTLLCYLWLNTMYWSYYTRSQYIYSASPLSVKGESVRLRFKWVHSLHSLRIGYFGANDAVILRFSIVCLFLSSPPAWNVRKEKIVVLCFFCPLTTRHILGKYTRCQNGLFTPCTCFVCLPL